MRKIALLLALALSLGGCTGVPVVYSGECDCPTAAPVSAENAVKTGLHISAEAEGDDGEIRFHATVAAVTIDDGGVIRACAFDGVDADLRFDEAGKLLSDIDAKLATRRSLAPDAWTERADAFAALAVGKTIEELKDGAEGSEELVACIEAAAADASYRGAQTDDELRLAILAASSDSSADDGESASLQFDCDLAAVTLRGEVISSCRIDSVQAAIPLDANGAPTLALPASFPGKNQLGEEYGLKKYAGSRYEWNEQADAFSRYVVGKTADEVMGIAVNERSAPTQSDLSASVTISIGGFQALIDRAARP